MRQRETALQAYKRASRQPECRCRLSAVPRPESGTVLSFPDVPDQWGEPISDFLKVSGQTVCGATLP